MNADGITSLMGRAIDFVFVDDRRATSMGILFGGVVLFFVKLFAPALQQQTIVDFTAVPLYLYPVVGVFGFNAPRFFRGEALPRTAETRLKVVRAELRAKRLTPDEAHALYKTVLEEELANLLAERQVNPSRPRKPRGPRETAATA
jgi:hypothetical protein